MEILAEAVAEVSRAKPGRTLSKRPFQRKRRVLLSARTTYSCKRSLPWGRVLVDVFTVTNGEGNTEQ